jgi:DNA-binding CsgD family transcriptional regulator
MPAAAQTLPGRERDLARLGRALAEAAAGAGRSAIVAGEAGVGKTALVEAFAGTAAAAGAAVVRGRCLDGAWQPPYAPWRETLDALGVGGEAQAELGAADARLRLYRDVYDALRALPAGRALAIVLDDLHWADDDSLALAAPVASALAAAPVLLVATVRDPDAAALRAAVATALGELARAAPCDHLRLAGLEPDALLRLLEQEAGGTLPGAIAGAVGSATGGNPFFAVETFHHLVEEGVLRRVGGRWTSTASTTRLGVPAGVRRVVSARCARLDEPARRLLDAAALLAGDASGAVLGAIAELDADELAGALDAALASGLLARSGDPVAPYAFAHAIVRDAVAAGANPERSAHGHLRAAAALAASGASAAAVAEQAHAARGLPAAAALGVDACLAAAREARAGQAPVQAARFAAMALELAPASDPRRGAALALRAVLAAEALDGAAAVRAATDALPALPGDDERLDLLARVADALRQGAERGAWEPLVQQGLALAGHRRDAAWARLAVLAEPVEPVLSGPIWISRFTAYPEGLAAALEATGDEHDAALAIEPFRARGLSASRRLLARSRAWRDPAARLRALDIAGRDLSLRHARPREALDAYAELLAVAIAAGSLPAEVEARSFLAICHALLGEMDAAEREGRRARGLVRTVWPGHRLHALVAIGAPGVIGAITGHADWAGIAVPAERFVRQPEAGRVAFAIVMAGIAAAARARSGEHAAAVPIVEAIAEAVRRADAGDHGYGGAIWFATDAAVAIGDAALARRALAALRAFERRGGHAGVLPTLDLPAARLELLAEGGSSRLDAARAAFAERGMRPLVVHCEIDAARAAGDAARADRAAAEARALGLPALAAEAGAIAARATAPAVAPPAGLSPREREVLALVAAGLTSAEVAGRLVISLPTVRRHLANAYAKAGVRNRAEATAFALQHDLKPPASS